MQAYIGGIVSMSTVDWPKNICTVIFFAGCDFRCPYCQNSDIISFSEENVKDIKEIKREIRKNLGFIDAVLFSGGEPTLQRLPLIELGSFAKKHGLKVGIETNGSKPHVIEYLIREGILDFVGLDIKAPLSSPELFEKVTRSKTFFKTVKEGISNEKKTLEILKKSEKKIDLEFRTTIVPRLLYRKEDVLEIAKMVHSLNMSCRWSIQQFRSDLGNVLDPMYRNLQNPKKKFLEKLKAHCLEHFPNLRIDVKGV